MSLTLEQYLKQETLEELNKITNNPKFKTEVNKLFAEKCDPYVPYITGELSRNIKVDQNGITYQQPYASNVYDSMNVHNKEHHPLASSKWDEVAFANHKEELEEGVKEIIERWTKTKQ